ncbi:MAG: hypothetical protein K2J51_08540 [Alistipes sp.]|nr:hypothetical protein [Alistipes sp.]
MNRKHLADLFREAADLHGYAFVEAPESAVPGMIRSYPVLWLSPPVLKSKEGRLHGRMVYSVRLRLLDDVMRLPPAQRAARHDAAERELVALFTELSLDDGVAFVDRLSIRIAEFSLAPHGELSAEAEAEIVTIY